MDTRRALTLILVALFCGALAIALPLNGLRSIWDTSESRYAEASREMVATGEWLVPLIDGEPHLTKPPLSYWLYASSMKVFGVNEAAVRLPCALAYAFSVVVVTLLAVELSGTLYIGLVAGLFQMFSPLMMSGSHVVTTDVFLAALEPAYILALFKAVNAKAGGRWWCLLGWAVIGLAFLTKGPPALLSALAFGVFLLIRRRPGAWRQILRPEAILLFVALSLSWYIVVLQRVPGALQVWQTEALHKVFVNSERNMPRMLYPLILLGGCLPATIAMVATVFRNRPTAARIRGYLRRDSFLLCVVWIAVPLCIFMAAKTRLPLYVIPLTAPLSIAGALAIAPRWKEVFGGGRRAFPWQWAVFFALIAVTFVGMKAYYVVFPDAAKDMKPLAAAIRVDAKQVGKAPELFITMGREGNGLLFYLHGPPADRLQKNSSDPAFLWKLHQIPRPNRSVKLQAFSRPLPTAGAQYIILPKSREESYAKGVENLFVPVFENRQYAVWRRTGIYDISQDNGTSGSAVREKGTPSNERRAGQSARPAAGIRGRARLAAIPYAQKSFDGTRR